jgi:hypothetical protein
MDARMDEPVVLDGSPGPLETTNDRAAQGLDRARLEVEMDLQVSDLEERGVRHRKSFPK